MLRCQCLARLSCHYVQTSLTSQSDSSASRIKTRRLKLAAVAALSHSAAQQQACVRYHAVRGRAIGPPPSFRWIRRARKNQDPKTSKTRREQITDGASKGNDASNGTHFGSLPCVVDRAHAERGRARVVKRPMLAALGRSGVEASHAACCICRTRPAYTRLACKSRIDRHHGIVGVV